MSRAARSLARARSLLEAQHDALLSGDLGRLADMPDDLARAIDLLTQDPPAAAELARLSSLAARNAALIRAAQAGLATAVEAASRPASAPLATYDATGRRAAAATPGRLLSRG